MALFTLSDVGTTPTKATPEEELVYDQKTATQYADPEDNVKVAVTLDGSPWTTEAFYNQVLKEDDTPRQLDLGVDPSLQQYIKINNFIISVTGSLEASLDKATGISRVSGTGQLYSTIYPHLGDMFVARMKDGKLGLFVVDNVQRMNYLKNTGFEIEYHLFDYHNSNFQADLTRKTIDSFNFNQDGVICGTALTKAGGIKNPGLTLVKLVNWYYDLFFDMSTETTLYPEVSKIYDPFVTPFFNALVDHDLRGSNPKLKLYTCQMGEYKDNMTSIWDVMIKSNEFGINRIKKITYLETPSAFSSPMLYGDIVTSHVRQVIWLSDSLTLNDELTDGYAPYVFSKSFYDKDLLNMKVLERSVYQAICGEKPESEFLESFVNSLAPKSQSELFYLIPIAIYLIKVFMS